MNMENKDTFKMTYSAQQQEEVNQIRQKYAPKTPDKMEQLRALDASVEKKATAVSIAVGVIGTLILGIGMSLAMSDLGAILGSAAFIAGIIIGVVGIAVLGCAYPLYNRTLKKERKKIAPEILKLADEFMK